MRCIGWWWALVALIFGSCGGDPVNTQQEAAPFQDTYVKPFERPEGFDGGWERFDVHFEKNKTFVNDHRVGLLTNHARQQPLPASSFPMRSQAIQSSNLEAHFFPLDLDTTERYQYVHEYAKIYAPHRYRYADVAFPNPCYHGDTAQAQARVVLTNPTQTSQTWYYRLFYQNTSYWYPTDAGMDANNPNGWRSNYYGGSALQQVTLAPGETQTVYIPYTIGKDPKGEERQRYRFYGPARPGAYEFGLWVDTDPNHPLLAPELDYTEVNPFAYLQQAQREGRSLANNWAYTHAQHFKFITLQETFDGTNIYTPDKLYLISDKDNKPLCDTCQGYFKDVLTDEWTTDDFFKGFIAEAPWIKVPYGNRKENVRIDERGIFLRVPGSTPEQKQKTWGEIKFGPSFLYGTVKVVAKLAQLRHPYTHTPTGVVHNIWLYEFNHPYADPVPGHPYAYMVNDKGKQPYEIDIEIWSKIYDENWGGGSAINYSIVDYMRDANVVVKPKMDTTINDRRVDRSNDRQLNYPGTELLRQDFFNEYHLYEIVWTPHSVQYKIDGEERAFIDWTMASIPNQYSFLWLGSPIYQDGTYYAQDKIPFLPYDLFSHIRYISIE